MERRLEKCHFAEPRVPVFQPVIVPALAQKPFVVFTGPGLVIRDLLSENVAIVHVLEGLTYRMKRDTTSRPPCDSTDVNESTASGDARDFRAVGCGDVSRRLFA